MNVVIWRKESRLRVQIQFTNYFIVTIELCTWFSPMKYKKKWRIWDWVDWPKPYFRLKINKRRLYYVKRVPIKPRHNKHALTKNPTKNPEKIHLKKNPTKKQKKNPFTIHKFKLPKRPTKKPPKKLEFIITKVVR